ncbi:MbnP family protein [Chitinophagaceae bacterium LWZ2-11]
MSKKLKEISRLFITPFRVGVLLFSFAFLPGKQHTITLQFNHIVGSQSLQLFDTEYSNSFGEVFVVNKFKYYVSNITIIDGKGQAFPIADSYFLIDEADSLSKSIKIQTPVNNITAIEFLVGVDSLKNVSGVQTGVLDPMNGMFWTWSTGYVYAKLEGRAPISKAPSHYYSYHVGGYKPGENALRKIKLSLPAGIVKNISNITITTDILKWFQSVENIKIAETPLCHEPGNLASRLANNYATMFSIQAVQ